MYFFTHLLISKVLYRHFEGEISLDRRAFAYGNIKPDLPSPERIHHTLDQCIHTVCEKSSKLMENEVTLEDFSVILGEVCHYVCDFFCYYHLSEKMHNRKLRHCFYEIALHLEMHRLRTFQGWKAKSANLEPRRDIRSIVEEIRQEYYSEPHKMKRDIDYALKAAIWACESILYYLRVPSDIAELSEDAERQLAVHTA